MAVILFYQKKLPPSPEGGMNLLLKERFPPSPLASGEFCPHPLKGSYSKTLIKYLQLKFINRLILLPRHELSIVTQMHKWGVMPHPRWLAGSFAPIP